MLAKGKVPKVPSAGLREPGADIPKVDVTRESGEGKR
jgi:hypothetical protein